MKLKWYHKCQIGMNTLLFIMLYGFSGAEIKVNNENERLKKEIKRLKNAILEHKK